MYRWILAGLVFILSHPIHANITDLDRSLGGPAISLGGNAWTNRQQFSSSFQHSFQAGDLAVAQRSTRAPVLSTSVTDLPALSKQIRAWRAQIKEKTILSKSNVSTYAVRLKQMISPLVGQQEIQQDQAHTPRLLADTSAMVDEDMLVLAEMISELYSKVAMSRTKILDQRLDSDEEVARTSLADMALVLMAYQPLFLKISQPDVYCQSFQQEAKVLRALLSMIIINSNVTRFAVQLSSTNNQGFLGLKLTSPAEQEIASNARLLRQIIFGYQEGSYKNVLDRLLPSIINVLNQEAANAARAGGLPLFFNDPIVQLFVLKVVFWLDLIFHSNISFFFEMDTEMGETYDPNEKKFTMLCCQLIANPYVNQIVSQYFELCQGLSKHDFLAPFDGDFGFARHAQLGEHFYTMVFDELDSMIKAKKSSSLQHVTDAMNYLLGITAGFMLSQPANPASLSNLTLRMQFAAGIPFNALDVASEVARNKYFIVIDDSIDTKIKTGELGDLFGNDYKQFPAGFHIYALLLEAAAASPGVDAKLSPKFMRHAGLMMEIIDKNASTQVLSSTNSISGGYSQSGSYAGYSQGNYSQSSQQQGQSQSARGVMPQTAFVPTPSSSLPPPSSPPTSSSSPTSPPFSPRPPASSPSSTAAPRRGSLARGRL